MFVYCGPWSFFVFLVRSVQVFGFFESLAVYCTAEQGGRLPPIAIVSNCGGVGVRYSMKNGSTFGDKEEGWGEYARFPTADVARQQIMATVHSIKSALKQGGVSVDQMEAPPVRACVQSSSRAGRVPFALCLVSSQLGLFLRVRRPPAIRRRDTCCVCHVPAGLNGCVHRCPTPVWICGRAHAQVPGVWAPEQEG